MTWQQADISRQALSKHLGVLEEAGLVRVEWVWRSKHHFIEREPIRLAWKLWLGELAKERNSKGAIKSENRRYERTGR